VALLRVPFKITLSLFRPKKTRGLRVKEEEEQPLLADPQPPGLPEVNKVQTKVS